MTDMMQTEEKQSKRKRGLRPRKETHSWTSQTLVLGLMLFAGLMAFWAVMVWSPLSGGLYEGLAAETSAQGSAYQSIAFVVGLSILWGLTVLVVTRWVRSRGTKGWAKALLWMAVYGLLVSLMVIPTWEIVTGILDQGATIGTVASMAVTYYSFALLLYLAFMAGRVWRPLSPGEIIKGPGED